MHTQSDYLLTVTICGGGNGAHTAAGYLGSKGNIKVNVLTRKPKEWASTIVVSTKNSSWEEKGSFVGKLNCVTDDPAEVIPSSDIIIIGAPANAHSQILKKIAKYITPKMILGTLYAQGGFDWAAMEALGGDLSKVDCLFGIQNIPWLCRIIKYGHETLMMGPKKSLWVATSPINKSTQMATIISLLFDIPAKIVPNFLSLTLTPSNQIIHPGRYYGIFHKWDGKSALSQDEVQWGLYNEMDDLSAGWMQKLDDELQAIKNGLEERYPQLDLSYVLPLKDRVITQYQTDVGDPSSLKTVFATNRAYNGCKTPATPVEGGFTPALKSRLFWEDIPFGLCILKNIAQMMGISTPDIDFMIEWHQQFMGTKFLIDGKLNPETIPITGTPNAYNIYNLDSLVSNSLAPLYTFNSHTNNSNH